MRYRIELTEKQMKVTIAALEEYFRLRMGQDFDFTGDMAKFGIDLSQDSPNHERNFDRYIAKRDHLHALMGAVFTIAYEPDRYLVEKTDEMLIAECIWDSMRVATGTSRWPDALQTGSEPLPKIEKITVVGDE